VSIKLRAGHDDDSYRGTPELEELKHGPYGQTRNTRGYMMPAEELTELVALPT